MIYDGLKDWEVARIVFGKNTKKECKIIKDLRKHGKTIPHCDGWSIIIDTRIDDDCGLLIPNVCLKEYYD
jgi:hypothetical protein